MYIHIYIYLQYIYTYTYAHTHTHIQIYTHTKKLHPTTKFSKVISFVIVHKQLKSELTFESFYHVKVLTAHRIILRWIQAHMVRTFVAWRELHHDKMRLIAKACLTILKMRNAILCYAWKTWVVARDLALHFRTVGMHSRTKYIHMQQNIFICKSRYMALSGLYLCVLVYIFM